MGMASTRAASPLTWQARQDARTGTLAKAAVMLQKMWRGKMGRRDLERKRSGSRGKGKGKGDKGGKKGKKK